MKTIFRTWSQGSHHCVYLSKQFKGFGFEIETNGPGYLRYERNITIKLTFFYFVAWYARRWECKPPKR